jgi:broad specificity phosphatase PhoE
VAIVFGEPMWAKPGEGPVDFMERIKVVIASLRDEYSPIILGPATSSKGVAQ